MTLTYLMAVWMLRRLRPMPLYSSWNGRSVLYVELAHPAQIIAARAVEFMAKDALLTPKCPCCESYDVTLEHNSIARWVQCHNPRCGLTHHAATDPEVAEYFDQEFATT